MTEYILVIMIAVTLAAVLVYVIVKKLPDNPKDDPVNPHVFVRYGVNLKTMQYGMGKGERFLSDQLNDKGTIQVEGNALPLCTIILTNALTGKEYKKSFRTELLIGRVFTGENQNNKIVIEGDGYISKTHCKIRYFNQQLLLDDLNTPNHTFLNGMKVIGTCVLHQNDELKIGETRLIVRYTGVS